MSTMSRPFATAAPLSRFRESPAEAVDDPAEDRLAVTMAESFWLKEAKATLRARDPVDAANDAEALARWADLQCGDILQTFTATFQGDQNG